MEVVRMGFSLPFPFEKGTQEEIVAECAGFLDDLFHDKLVFYRANDARLGAGFFYRDDPGDMVRWPSRADDLRAGTWSGPWVTDWNPEHVSHALGAETEAALFANDGGRWPVVTQDVAEGRAEVTVVYHDPGGGWWFDSDADEAWMPECLPCLLTRHPDLAQHADLPLNWAAWRSADGGWTRGPRPADWGPWEDGDAIRA
jgi:hypothetical protein